MAYNIYGDIDVGRLTNLGVFDETLVTGIAGSIAYSTNTNEPVWHNGAVWSPFGGGNTIYSADDNLTGNRTVTGGDNLLSFTDLSAFLLQANGASAVNGLVQAPTLNIDGAAVLNLDSPVLNLVQVPPTDNTNPNFLVRDVSGQIELRDLSTVSADFYSNDLTATASRNHAVNAGVTIQQVMTSTTPGRTNTIAWNGDGNASQVALAGNTTTFNQTDVITFLEANSAAGVNRFEVGLNRLQLEINPTADLQVNGDPGTAGQVLTSNGANLPPTWQAGTATGGIYSGSGSIQAGTTTVTGNATNTLLFNNIGITHFQDIGPSGYDVIFDGVTNAIQVRSFATGTPQLNLNASGAALSNQGSTFSMVSTTGPTFTFAAGHDMRIGGVAGAVGDQVTSNGVGAAPVWGPPASDIALKNSIIDLDYGLETLMKLVPKRFKYNGYNDERIGFSAQDVQEVIPEAVAMRSDDFLGLRKDDIVAVLVNAVKQLKFEIDKLKGK